MEFTDEQKKALGYYESDDANVLKECAPKMDMNEALLHALQMGGRYRSRHIQCLNRTVANAVDELTIMGQWEQLEQILRTLPDAVLRALQMDEKNRDGAFHIIHDTADAQKAFNALSLKGKQRALELLRENPVSE